MAQLAQLLRVEARRQGQQQHLVGFAGHAQRRGALTGHHQGRAGWPSTWSTSAADAVSSGTTQPPAATGARRCTATTARPRRSSPERAIHGHQCRVALGRFAHGMKITAPSKRKPHIEVCGASMTGTAYVP